MRILVIDAGGTHIKALATGTSSGLNLRPVRK